jgi:hypothetical protein
MRIVPTLVSLAACSCMGFTIIPTTGDSSPSGGDAATTGSDDGGEGGTSIGETGIDCGPDPDTGVVLCLGISSCPNLVVDSDLYPGCGFRVHPGSDVLDLECACYGEICPIGIASTCDAATALMQDQSQYTVCMQVDEGRCTSN